MSRTRMKALVEMIKSDGGTLPPAVISSVVASKSLIVSESEIQTAAGAQDMGRATRERLMEEAATYWGVDWRAAEHALDSLVAVVHAFLRFCTVESSRERLSRALEILDGLREIANEGRRTDPSSGDIAALIRSI